MELLFTFGDDTTITEGSIKYEDGSEYNGQIKNNKRHGKGIFIDASGVKYTGQWKEDKKEGHGTLEGSYFKFVGEWRNDEKWKGEEIGVYEKYIGDWSNNKYHGQGKLYRNAWPWYVENKSTKFILAYEGCWKDGKKHGKGKSYLGMKNKLSHYLAAEGEWKDGVRHGLFKEYALSGKLVFEGQYQNGVRNGPGIAYEDRELRFEANWKDGKMSGFGKRFFRGVLQFEGIFENATEKNGKIFDYYDNKLIYQGDVKLGQYHIQHGYGVQIAGEAVMFEGEWIHNYKYLGIEYNQYHEVNRKGIFSGGQIADGISFSKKRIKGSFHEVRRLPNGDVFKLVNTVDFLWIGKMAHEDSIAIGTFQGISPLAQPSVMSRYDVLVQSKNGKEPRIFQEWRDKKLVSSVKYLEDWTQEDVVEWIENHKVKSWRNSGTKQMKMLVLKKLAEDRGWNGLCLMNMNSTQKLEEAGIVSSTLQNMLLNLIKEHKTSKTEVFVTDFDRNAKY